jgi:hypothetical protein
MFVVDFDLVTRAGELLATHGSRRPAANDRDVRHGPSRLILDSVFAERPTEN